MKKNKKIIINKPYVKKNRLYSKIEYEGKEYDMYYEVEDEYSKYLCDDNSDAFLVSLIPFIVKHNYDVKVEGVISSKLYYQITNYLLPILCSEFKKNDINIECELTNKNFNSKGVGASVSCGVDSFYTMLKHKNQKDESYNITHLTFFNAGSHGDFGGEKSRNLFNDRLKFIRKFCEENNYKLVTVDTNMNELIMMHHKKTHSFRTLGCVLALQKLFGKYYFASGYHYNEMQIDEESCGHYDTLNVQCLSNETLTFYCSGQEVTRMEKVKFISDYPMTYNWLNVCVRTDDNCGECIKCVRTQAELDSIGKLENYKKVFDIEKFKKKKIKFFSEIIAEARNKKGCDAMYFKEIIDNYKNNNNPMPIMAHLLSYLPIKKKIKNFLKAHLSVEKVNKLKDKIKPDRINDGWMD